LNWYFPAIAAKATARCCRFRRKDQAATKTARNGGAELAAYVIPYQRWQFCLSQTPVLFGSNAGGLLNPNTIGRINCRGKSGTDTFLAIT